MHCYKHDQSAHKPQKFSEHSAFCTVLQNSAVHLKIIIISQTNKKFTCERGSKMNESVQSWLRHGRMSGTQSSVLLFAWTFQPRLSRWLQYHILPQVPNLKLPSLLSCTQIWNDQLTNWTTEHYKQKYLTDPNDGTSIFSGVKYLTDVRRKKKVWQIVCAMTDNNYPVLRNVRECSSGYRKANHSRS